jgi:4-hydroxyphenylacetate 3-monooxygenase
VISPPVSDQSAARSRPFTSEEYFESLRDGREIWIYGERVKDVTTHPAFRNTVRMLGRLYDALHDQRKSVLCTDTDTGSGGYTHKFFKAPRSAEEMVGSRDAIAEWARVTYGWMGRSPDYKAAFLATLGANAEFYDPFTENARRWYKKVQEEVTFVNHAIVNPPVDRNKQLEEVRDVYMHVEKETDGGLIVSGAKVVATTDDVHPDALQLHCQQRSPADQDEGFRIRLYRGHRRPRREVVLPSVL